jgi:hypothetical protein
VNSALSWVIFIACIGLSIYTVINLISFLTGKTCDCESTLEGNVTKPNYFRIKGVDNKLSCEQACASHNGKETNLSFLNISNNFGGINWTV